MHVQARMSNRGGTGASLLGEGVLFQTRSSNGNANKSNKNVHL